MNEELKRVERQKKNLFRWWVMNSRILLHQ
jgi:hypothetical protein